MQYTYKRNILSPVINNSQKVYKYLDFQSVKISIAIINMGWYIHLHKYLLKLISIVFLPSHQNDYILFSHGSFHIFLRIENSFT
ncbi:hypothetical protein SDC9_208294 [bioreactor metagenome]|uniref:Uncharacterized protein n=1 Tax=bioreactor metagenome TaxID=1076179 RepID=A0A645JA66_9ZZZZ